MTRSLILSILLATASTAAQECVDYGDFLRRVGNAPTVGSARSVAVVGDVAYLADGDAGFTVIDLSDPTAPVPLANLASVGTALWIAHHEDHVYVTDNAAELHVIDVSSPDRPLHVLTVPLPGSGRALALRPPLMLIAAGHAGLLVLDVNTPAQPLLLGIADTPGIARGVDVDGDLVAVADENALLLVDISSPQQPTLLGSTPTLGLAYGVVLDGDTAAVAGWDSGLEIHDVSVPAAPYPVALLDQLPGPAKHLQRRGDLVFLAAGVLCVVDLSIRHEPRLIGQADTGDGPISVTMDGGLALVPTGDGGLDVFDADPPGSPPVFSLTGVEGVAFGVDTRGTITAVGADDLDFFDHSDPANPVLLGTLPFGGTTSRLAFAGDTVVLTVAGAVGRVLLVDASDPTDPVLASAPELDGIVSQLTVKDSLVYLADFVYGGLFVLDIADPERPDVVGTAPSRPFAQHLRLVGEHLLVGTGGFADPVIQVFDLANPHQPQLVHEYFPGGEGVNGLASGDDRVYATVQQGYGSSVLLVLDASDPTALTPLGSLALPVEMHEVELDGQAVYACTYEGVVHVIDVSDPADPRPIGQTYLPDSAFVLAVSDDAVHAAVTDAGLALLPRHCATAVSVEDDGTERLPRTAPTMLAAHPNPFNPRVSLTFTLASGGPAALTVHDLAGRRVATVFRGELAAGGHALAWEGRDDAGRALPSGVYLARLVGPAVSATARLVLVR